MPRRIGILGGSFNPAHQGHLDISRAAIHRLGLDQVWWLVSPQNPLKKKEELAPLSRRIASARKRAKGRRVRVTAIEKALGTRFTVDTLAALRRRFPKVHFVWLMGSDTFVQLPRWRRWKRIFGLVPVAVVPRPGSALKLRHSRPARLFAKARMPARMLTDKPPAWTILRAAGVSASATRLRAQSSWNR